ncbi:MAG: pirin family protein [bacterium]|nr:pirin family protein [bacterium]
MEEYYRESEHPDVDMIVRARSKELEDIQGLTIRRVLPYARRRTVGPFTFLDHFGPAQIAPGAGMDVRPHPHIGLATVTYHFEGLGGHKDSLGVDQVIRPGDINWMTAGRGIVHSERTPADVRAAGQRIHGMQAWVALPVEYEEIAPEFHHHPENALPAFELGDARVRLLAGSIAGHSSPVKIYSPLFYLDVRLPASGSFELDSEGMEAAVYLAHGPGGLKSCDENVAVGELLVYRTGAKFQIRNADDQNEARLMLLGGQALPEKRTIYWNFVSSRKERIEQAKADWREGRFPPVPGDDDFIPLPPD